MVEKKLFVFLKIFASQPTTPPVLVLFGRSPPAVVVLFARDFSLLEPAWGRKEFTTKIRLNPIGNRSGGWGVRKWTIKIQLNTRGRERQTEGWSGVEWSVVGWGG